MIIRLTVTHENENEVSIETNSPASAHEFLTLCNRPDSHVHIDVEDSLDSPNDAFQYLAALGLAMQHFPIAKLPCAIRIKRVVGGQLLSLAVSENSSDPVTCKNCQWLIAHRK